MRSRVRETASRFGETRVEKREREKLELKVEKSKRDKIERSSRITEKRNIFEKLIETGKETTSNCSRENNLKEMVDKVTREKHIVEKEKKEVVNGVTNKTVTNSENNKIKNNKIIRGNNFKFTNMFTSKDVTSANTCGIFSKFVKTGDNDKTDEILTPMPSSGRSSHGTGTGEESGTS